jgi:hypothetical protein
MGIDLLEPYEVWQIILVNHLSNQWLAQWVLSSIGTNLLMSPSLVNKSLVEKLWYTMLLFKNMNWAWLLENNNYPSWSMLVCIHFLDHTWFSSLLLMILVRTKFNIVVGLLSSILCTIPHTQVVKTNRKPSIHYQQNNVRMGTCTNRHCQTRNRL